MPYLSSPIEYPASSLPPADNARKRKRTEGSDRSPLRDINANVRRGGFLADSSDEDEEAGVITKRTAVEGPRVEAPAGNHLPATAKATHKATEHISIDVVEETRNADVSIEVCDTGLGASLFESRGRRLSLVRGESQDSLYDVDYTTRETSSNVVTVRTCHGKSVYIGEREGATPIAYERLVAARSSAIEGHARKSYYGIDIHQLMDDMPPEPSETLKTTSPMAVRESIETESGNSKSKGKTLMWTEKYRARKFTDLVGDERTHRQVLRWLKNWDSIVFPGSSRSKKKSVKDESAGREETPHRKILMLTGPPGLGKTTLAHVCARQAGYEVQEINASDERSRDVVRGRIHDMVGTENVRGLDARSEDGKVSRKAGRPVCVVVDEVDGVVGGSGSSGGEGGFVKALIDLVLLDQRNSSHRSSAETHNKGKKKGEKFRILRPLILICNDVYHPSLRPLRQSSLAEIIHVRKPPLNMVISRLHSIFEKEGIPSDTDAVRRLCESTWGVTSRKGLSQGSGTADGDIRSVLVTGEWVATKLRASVSINAVEGTRLTRPWFEEHVLNDLSPGGGAARSLGRGGTKDIVDRVFLLGAGFPPLSTKQAAQQKAADQEAHGVIGVAEGEKRRAMDKLREIVGASGDTERIMTDCFTSYPTQPIQDDTFLSKPSAAYDWLDFHDRLNSQLLSSQDWELAPYTSTPILGFHHLFAASASARAALPSTNSSWTNKGAWAAKDDTSQESQEPELPFSGPSAPFMAAETLKANQASIQLLQAGLSLPLARMYHSPTSVATELLPYALRMLAPDVKPVVVHTSSTAGNGTKTAIATASVRKASEKALVGRAVQCMAATGVRFEKTRVENDRPGPAGRANGGYVFRMEPPVDVLGCFETFDSRGPAAALSSSGTTLPARKGPAEGAGVRYAVRQVLEQEWKREVVRINEETRKRRMNGDAGEEDREAADTGLTRGAATGKSIAPMPATSTFKPKRDFFGRVISAPPSEGPTGAAQQHSRKKSVDGRKGDVGEEVGRVWVSFHEGFSNAVRKPVTMEEFMRGL